MNIRKFWQIASALLMVVTLALGVLPPRPVSAATASLDAWVNLLNNMNPDTISFSTDTILRVQNTTANTGVNPATSFQATLTAAPVNGNTLVAVISTRGTSADRVSSITQTGATWTRVAQATNTNGTTTEIWYAPGVSGAGTAITITQASLRSAAVVVEYYGLLTPTSFDVSANTTGSGTAASTGTTATTSQADELWFGGIGLVNSGYTLGTPTNSFTAVANTFSTNGTAGNNARVYALERIVTATGTANSGGTVSTSSQWSGAIATFRKDSSTATTNTFTVSAGSNRLTLAGVCLETGANATISSIDVRLDSSTGTQFTQINRSTGSQREQCYMGYLKEASLSTGTHKLYVSVTMSADTITGIHISVGTYQGVDQTSPITASSANNAGSNTIPFGSDVSFVANSTTVYMTSHGNTATGITHWTTFTEVLGARAWAADHSTSIAEATNSASGTYVGSTSQVVWAGGSTRSAIVVASLNPSKEGTTTAVVCGGGTPVITVGHPINCVASVTRSGGGLSPSGTVNWGSDATGTFSPTTCSLGGTGATTTCSVDYTPTLVGDGTHLVTATYLGDSNFTGSSGSQTVTVNALPTITVTKTAAPLTVAEPGGNVVFTVTVENTSAMALTLFSLSDSVYGNLNGKGTCATGGTIAIGATYSCAFTGAVSGHAESTHTNTVTAEARDIDSHAATNTAQATVTITDELPTLTVTKTADPLTVAEPGGDVAFTVSVHNTSPESVTLTTLSDSVYGNLNGKGTCVTGGTIAADATHTCTFTGAVSGEAGTTHTNTVTATIQDNELNSQNGEAEATVTVTDVLPTLTVTKTADPLTVAEQGGDVDFTVTVENTSVEAVTLVSLSDSVYGTLNGKGTCATGGTIAIGATYTCTFTGAVSGVAGGTQTNIVTATVEDNELNTEDGTAEATVTFVTPLDLSDLDLLWSVDQVIWTNVNGTFAGGFFMALDPLEDWYYLDADNLVVNRTLADGYYPFKVTSYPAGYIAYWDVLGVNASADPLTWQGVMYQIILGNQPIFYLKVTGTDYMLVDGMTYLMGGGDAPLKINGTYLTGAYTFSGQVEDTLGITDDVAVDITFAVDAAPTVTAVTPLNNATLVAVNSNVSVTFSELVDVTASFFDITCASSGVHAASYGTTDNLTFTMDPAVDFTPGELCTVTIHKEQVNDQDPFDPPDNMAADYVWSFTVTPCGGIYTHIHDIQGSGLTSPLVGTPQTFEGIVVGDFETNTKLNSYFVQTIPGVEDADPATSEGIIVYNANINSVNVGDYVRVTGMVVEYATTSTGAMTQVTEISPVSTFVKCATGQTLPAATAITLPTTADVTYSLERYEGMLVTFPQTLTVQQNYFQGRFGQVTLGAGGRIQQMHNLGKNSGTLYEYSRMVVLDDGNKNQNQNPMPYYAADGALRAGDTVVNVTGVLDQGRINSSYVTAADSSFPLVYYRVHPTAAPVFTTVNTRPAAPVDPGGRLTVATYNMDNYFTTLDMAPFRSTYPYDGSANTPRGADSAAEFTRQQNKIVKVLAGFDADVLALIELESWDGAYGGLGAPQALADALNAYLDTIGRGGENYLVVADPTTGYFAPSTYGDYIQSTIFYREGVVTPVGASISTNDIVFDRSPFAQMFREEATGSEFIVVVNHFKSKSSCPVAGDPDADQGDGQGCWNVRRRAQSASLLTLINDVLIPLDPDVLVLGDLNSYGQEDPILDLQAGGLVNQVAGHVDAADRYSYVFDGTVGYLDHALSTGSMESQITDVNYWHINADEPSVIDYNTEFKGGTLTPDFYTNSPYRASDHDPFVLGLDLALPLELTDLDLLQSVDQATWANVPGTFAGGFTMMLDPLEDWYYLNADNLVVNRPLTDGYYPFYVDTHPAGYFAYWDAQGVNASADPLTWQGVMWQIINGDQPIFYLKVTGTDYMLVDGMTKLMGGGDTPLKINGTYLLGDYTFSGQVADIYDYEDVTVAITFVAPLNLTDLDLLQSVDQATWTTVPGTFAGGFTMALDPLEDWYYLDADNLVVNRPLADGYYPFKVTSYPAGYFAYWDVLGVNASADPLTWQGVMWQIINGSQPIFYLKVTGTDYMLVDGMTKLMGGGDTPLKINGTYLLGDYTFSGQVADTFGYTDDVTVGIKFVAPLDLSDLDLLQSVDQATWTTVPGTFAGGFTMALDPLEDWYYLDADNLVVNRPLADGYYPFKVTSYPAGYFAYWDVLGVNASADPLTWQGVMWQIINGSQPIFYLKVTGTDYMLVDGMTKLMGGGDVPLRINGTYLPGAYTFSGQVADTFGYTDDVAVEITFNSKPVAQDGTVVTDEDTAVAIILVAADLGGDPLTWHVGTPVHGDLTGTAPNLTYTPDLNYNGADSFTFYVDDGELDSNTATINITVNAVNDAPVAYDQTLSTNEDTDLLITLTASDVEGSTLNWFVDVGPEHGILSGTAPNLTYTPDPNYNGADSFTFFVDDGDKASNIATINITVNAVNDAPVAYGQALSTDEDTDLLITLTATDVESSPLTWHVGVPAHGSLSGTAPNLTYTPDLNYNGADSFTFYVDDGDLNSNTATINITVNPVNDSPVAVDDFYSVDEDTTLVVPAPGVLANDIEVDPDGIAAVLVTTPAHGHIIFLEDGSFTYIPDKDFNGIDTFVYRMVTYPMKSWVDDAVVTITVNPVNDDPVADVIADVEWLAREAHTYDVSGSFSDVDGDTLTFSAELEGSLPLPSWLSFDSDTGVFSGTPTNNVVGVYPIVVTADDGNGGQVTSTFTLTVVLNPYRVFIPIIITIP